MVRLIWGQSGERTYEAGVDRGVLYLSEGKGVPWNGLTSVTEDHGDIKTTPYYRDGHRYHNDRSPSEFSAVIKAFTYPDEFAEFDGYQEATLGYFLDEQPVEKTFGLSYRTQIGNDLEGVGYGYKIHILYNLTATPSTKTYATRDNSVDAMEFSWDVIGVPEELEGFKPTNHIILDTRFLQSSAVSDIENLLYGTDFTDPRIPVLSELIDMIFNLVDNGDGSWTVTGSFESVQYVGEGEFQLTWPGIEYVGDDMYTITNNPQPTPPISTIDIE